jgi:ABC-2 type transport system ATP-binding protein
MVDADLRAPANEPALELRRVRKRFGERLAVNDVDLTVPRGATYGLLGPNGAGKTTTIRMILRILEPDAGSIRMLGRPLAQPLLDRIGYLPEERGLYKHMRVGRLLTFFAEIKGVARKVARTRAGLWLERLELADRWDARVQELSKGMQQKVQFIAAMLHDPDIVILDEPFSGLDPLNQRVLREIITDLRGMGKTVLFSTHIIEHAERICDHVCIIAQGRLVLNGPVRDVKRQHGGEYVRLGFDRWDAAALAIVRASSVVGSVREEGSEAEVSLRGDPQVLLAELVNAGLRVRRFELIEPSLEQIFVERVGAAAARGGVVAHV